MSDRYAKACTRIAEEVAVALTFALGEEWAEWGEGGLADGVRELMKQRDAAGQAGALKALRTLDADLIALRDRLAETRQGGLNQWALGVEEAAAEARLFANGIELGEETV